MADSSRCSSAMKEAEIEDQYVYHDQEPEEESGWTSYFEDFEIMNQTHHTDNMSNSYSTATSQSILSGDISSSAASAAAWKSITGGSSQTPPPPKKLNLRKKSRTEQVSNFDDSLEDTATSPVSSPKMGNLMKTKMKPRSKRYDNKGSPLGKGEEISKEGHENKYEDLQKRGLCLVPFSMFAHYNIG